MSPRYPAAPVNQDKSARIHLTASRRARELCSAPIWGLCTWEFGVRSAEWVAQTCWKLSGVTDPLPEAPGSWSRKLLFDKRIRRIEAETARGRVPSCARSRKLRDEEDLQPKTPPGGRGWGRDRRNGGCAMSDVQVNCGGAGEQRGRGGENSGWISKNFARFTKPTDRPTFTERGLHASLPPPAPNS